MNGTKLRWLFLCRAEFIRPVAVGGYPHCGYIRIDRWNSNVVGRMNSTRYRKWGGICTVKVFVMEVNKVVRKWEESFRDREWFSHREALRRIKGKDLQQIVRQLPDFV